MAIETAAVSLRANPRLAVRGARGSHDSSDFLLVKVATSRGVIGYGEVSATLRWSGEDATSANDAIKRVLAPAVIGQPLHPVTGLALRMDLALAGNPFTKAGAGDARSGMPWAGPGTCAVVDLLGGPHRTEVPTKMSLSGDGDRLVDGHRGHPRAGLPVAQGEGRACRRRRTSRASGWPARPAATTRSWAPIPTAAGRASTP